MNHSHTLLRRTLLALVLAAGLCLQTLALPAYLIPGGNAVGIRLYADGLLVTELEEGMAAEAAGLRRGDTIVAVNGRAAVSAQVLAQTVQEGRELILRIRRSDRQAEYLLKPQKVDGEYRLGLHLRDNISGIGTVTYYDPLNGGFGALGHGVIGPVGSRLLPITNGCLVGARVAQVHPGSCGVPGELCGEYDPELTLGTVTRNEMHGIFGRIDDLPDRQALPVASAQDVHTGQAAILTNVSGSEVGTYAVQIEKLCPDPDSGRDLLLHITDERLLSQTGGIVQGMSGSPIVQDGRLVGAVTHVLVNDPSMGYGVLIENMLRDAA